MLTDNRSIVIDGDRTYDFINEALDNISIDDIEFRHCDFHDDDIKIISQKKDYKRIAFVECSFENPSILSNIITNSISFTNCPINDYSFISKMTYLTRLTIVNGKIVANIINNLKDLSYLRLSHSNISNFSILKLNKLKYLFVDNSNLDNLSFVENFPSLQLLSLSDEQIINNEKIISNIKNNVKIICNSIIETEVLFDE